MKAIVSLLALSIILSTSCRKDKEAAKGQWRWSVTYQGGFIGHTITPDAHSVVTLSLNNDSTYITYLNNEITHQGKYSITKQDSMPDIIHFDKNISTGKLIIGQDEMLSYAGTDSLTLFDGYVEGTSYYFTRNH